VKNNNWDLEKIKDATTQLFYRGNVAVFLEEEKAKDIQDKDQLVSVLNTAMKQAADEELKVLQKPRKPWISQDTLLLVEDKQAAKARRLKCPEAMKEYTDIYKKVKKSARKDKRIWIQEQCAKVEQNHTDNKEREAYKLVKQITGGFKGANARVIKDAHGTLLSKEDDILKRWTEYTQQLYSDSGAHNTSVISRLEAIHDRERSENYNEILVAEVERAIRRLKDRKSPGVDGIPSELIKAGGPELVSEIHRLCNIIWEEEE